jgi:hypothetical protein
MIVRILTEGQWEISDDVVRRLNPLDDEVEKAVRTGDQTELAEALHALLEQVRSSGRPIPDDELLDSDLILPDAARAAASCAWRSTNRIRLRTRS